MMKKLFALAILAAICLSAVAQPYPPYKQNRSGWDIGGRFGILYNHVAGIPQQMSHSGLGLDFCFIEGQYHVTRNTMLSLGLLDLQVDFRFARKGYIFGSDPAGSITKALEDSRAKASFSDVAFTFPFGISQKLGARWAASLYVAPGLGLIRYSNDYIAGEVHHRDSFYPTYSRTGFRLDVKAVLWFEDLGLTFRYQPIGFTLPESPGKSQTFSVGLVFCY